MKITSFIKEHVSFIKFAIVGVINTLVGTSVMYIAYNVGHFGYWPSTILNYCIGSIVSFILNKYFTFKSTKQGVKEIMPFILNIIACYIVAYGIAQLINVFFLNSLSSVVADNIAMGIGMCLFVICNYVGQRYFVFKNNVANS